jgi:hypothetical protein
MLDVERSAQWAAFDAVLNYLNTVDTKLVAKKDIYAAVMEMRPEDGGTTRELYEATTLALASMKIASAMTTVAEEYDFSAAITACRNAFVKARPMFVDDTAKAARATVGEGERE